jgi:hypothetical protein
MTGYADALRAAGYDDATIEAAVAKMGALTNYVSSTPTTSAGTDFGGGGLPLTGTSILPVQYNGEYYDPSDMTTPLGTDMLAAQDYMAGQSLLWNTQPVADPVAAPTGLLDFGSEAPSSILEPALTPGITYTQEQLDNFSSLDPAQQQAWNDATDAERQWFFNYMSSPQPDPEYQNTQNLTDNFYALAGTSPDQKTFMGALEPLISNLRHTYDFAPERFEEWAQANPQAATLFFARAGDSGIGYDIDINRDGVIDKADRQAAQDLAAQWGYTATGDKDTAIDFSGDAFKDVTNEWGAGDNFKIGTSQTANDPGMFDKILQNPITQIAALALAAPTGGLSTGALAFGNMLSDPENIGLFDLIGAASPFIPGGALNSFQLGSLSTADKIAMGLTALDDYTADTYQGIDPADDSAPEIVWQPSDITDILGDLQVQIPDYWRGRT